MNDRPIELPAEAAAKLRNILRWLTLAVDRDAAMRAGCVVTREAAREMCDAALDTLRAAS